MSSRMSRRDFAKFVGSTGVTLSVGGLGVLGCAPADRVARARRPVGAMDEAAFREFAAGFHGFLLRPSSPEYESALLTGWVLALSHAGCSSTCWRHCTAPAYLLSRS